METMNYIRHLGVIDQELNIHSASESLNEFLGQNSIYKLTKSIHPDDLERLENAISIINHGGHDTMVALRMSAADGEYKWVLISLCDSGQKCENGGLINIEIQEISKFRENFDNIQGANNELREYFSLMEQLMLSYDVRTGKLKIFTIGKNQQINFYSGTLENWKTSKLVNNEVDTKSIPVFERLYEDFKNGVASFEYELKIVMFDVSKKEWCLVKGKTILDKHNNKHVIATVSMVNPISKKSRNSLFMDGTKDASTDLLNKRTITKYIKNMLDSKPDNPVTIAIIDIDDFKRINDQYGHMFGDVVIQDVADIIKAAVETKGVAGRIGGDEMFVILEDVQADDEIRSILRTIRNNIAWLYNNTTDKPNVTCSIGSATYPTDATEYERLFDIADKMLYLAKEKGKNRYVIYRPDLHGAFVDGKGMPETDEMAFYKYRKIAVVNEVINEYSKNGRESFDKSLEKVMMAFSLDSIVVYDKLDDESWKVSCVKGETKLGDKTTFLGKDHYIPDFTKEGIKVIDNINFFERNAKTAYEELSGAGVCQAIQAEIRSYETPRIVSFDRTKQLSKWSEMDIMYLTVLGNVIGMGYSND